MQYTPRPQDLSLLMAEYRDFLSSSCPSEGESEIPAWLAKLQWSKPLMILNSQRLLRYAMDTTSPSLLERVKNTLDQEAWGRLVDVYAPFLFAWARNTGLSEADAADLVQEVLTVLARKLPEFDYDGSKSFRSWLKTVTVNRARNFHRAAVNRPTVGVDSAIKRDATVEANTDLFDEEEYCSIITKRLLESVASEFSDQVWRAFQMQMLEERPAAEVATELGISVNSVYLAKSRVLQRLRAEAVLLLD